MAKAELFLTALGLHCGAKTSPLAEQGLLAAVHKLLLWNTSCRNHGLSSFPAARGILLPWPEMEPVLEVGFLTTWTTRKVPTIFSYSSQNDLRQEMSYVDIYESILTKATDNTELVNGSRPWMIKEQWGAVCWS